MLNFRICQKRIGISMRIGALTRFFERGGFSIRENGMEWEDGEREREREREREGERDR